MASTAEINHYKNIPNVLTAFREGHNQILSIGLDVKLHHLLKLRASQMNSCAYCVNMHSEEARSDGETQQRLDRLIVWRHVEDFSEAERAALAWTEALTDLDETNDLASLREGLKKHFSDTDISGITAAIAMINLWNRIGVSNH
ncbi:MAG: carboxymuconolactone decarboxylase family protein [Roseibium sp.]